MSILLQKEVWLVYVVPRKLPLHMYCWLIPSVQYYYTWPNIAVITHCLLEKDSRHGTHTNNTSWYIVGIKTTLVMVHTLRWQCSLSFLFPCGAKQSALKTWPLNVTKAYCYMRTASNRVAYWSPSIFWCSPVCGYSRRFFCLIILYIQR